MMMKRLMLVAIAIFSLVSVVSAQKSAINAPKGTAVDGYDVVDFFSQGKPVKGSGAYTYQWGGANWLFESKANMELFAKSPEKFAPQYGGYCAYGASQGHKAPVEADTWSIVDGKLYFNYNKSVKEKWVKDQPAYIIEANKNWPLIKDKE